MLNILICEDNTAQRTRMERIVSKYILSGDFEMSLALSIENPDTLLSYVEAHRISSGLYILDIDLQYYINGIELAAKIRELDVSATIVFITTHSEMVHYAFKLKVEAMVYILKDNTPEEIEQRVIECIQTAYERFLNGKHAERKYFTIKIGSQHLYIPYEDILYFESSVDNRNKIVLHKVNGMLEFRGTIGSISHLELPFCKCHQSFIININHVKRLDTILREVEMADGTVIAIAKRKVSEVLKHMSPTSNA